MNLLVRTIRTQNLNCAALLGRRCFSANSTSDVLSENVNGKVILTLNRPEKLNTLNLSMTNQLYSFLKEINEKETADLVILKSNGRAFCAGGDVVAVVDSFKAGTSECKDFFSNEYKLNRLIRFLKRPFVALINGITMGGGCGVSINGRFQVATEQTMLAMPETALGLFPDVGGTYFLSRLKHELGMFLALTGHRLRGADVYHAGLASHYVSSESLTQLVDSLLNLPRKDCTTENVNVTLKKFLPSNVPSFSLEPNLNEINHCFSAETIEDVFERLKRSNTEFAQNQLKVLHKMSPTSLKVTFRQIRMGKTLTYDEVIPLEFRLTQKFLAGNDFHEGCRAILKDKDRNPKWNPSKIEDVTEEKLNWYFSP